MEQQETQRLQASDDVQAYLPEVFGGIRIFTPSDAISELSKLTGKNAEQLAVKMPKLKEQREYVQLHKFSPEPGQRDCISVHPAGFKGKKEPAWEYFVYLDNGEVGEWRPQTVEKVSGLRILKKIKDLFLSTPQFDTISSFVEKHKDKSVDEIKILIDEEASKNEFFKGVKKVEKKKTRNGNEAIILTVEKDYFASTLKTDAGYAYFGRGVIFIRDGFSDIAKVNLLEHELYHIDHGEGSISYITHEIETFIMGNLLDSFAGTVQLIVEDTLDTPGHILRLIRQVRINARMLFPDTNSKK